MGLTIELYAMNEKEAVILAQAEAIKNARNYELVYAKRMEQ